MKDYKIKQKFWSLGGKFDILDQNGHLDYQVEGSLLRIPKQFIILDKLGKPVSKITKRMFQILPKFDVEVRNGQNFQVKKNLTLIRDRYSVENLGLNLVGDLWDMNFKLYKADQEIASISQKWLKINSTYDVKIYDETYAVEVLSLVIIIDYVKQSEQSAVSKQWVIPLKEERENLS